MKSVFAQWCEGRRLNYGSFQTAILSAFQIADTTNRKALMSAFPNWFNDNDIKY